MNSDDRRKYKRELISPHLKIVLPDNNQSFGAFITNISGGGVEVYSDSKLDQGQNVNLHISFESDPKTGKDEVVSGVVKWVKLFGNRFLIGIEFKDVSPDKHPILSGFLEFVNK